MLHEKVVLISSIYYVLVHYPHVKQRLYSKDLNTTRTFKKVLTEYLIKHKIARTETVAPSETQIYKMYSLSIL